MTTQWHHAARFRETFPRVIFDVDRLLVDLSDIVTIGGVTAWTDLALHLPERFGGRSLMLSVAKMFVLNPPDREQSPYASFLPKLQHGDEKIRKVQLILSKRPADNHTIVALASVVAMSERSLLRRFRQATGLSPVAYLQTIWVEAARSRLELTRASFEQIRWATPTQPPFAACSGT